eukprot:226859-Chlamydomonas_euryale.AAC.2
MGAGEGFELKGERTGRVSLGGVAGSQSWRGRWEPCRAPVQVPVVQKPVLQKSRRGDGCSRETNDTLSREVVPLSREGFAYQCLAKSTTCNGLEGERLLGRLLGG